jgi:hypothetical protein
MVRRKKNDKVETLVKQLIHSEIERHLVKAIRKSRKRVTRETGKLREVFQLEYHRDSGFVDAEYQEMPKEEKGTENLPFGE